MENRECGYRILVPSVDEMVEKLLGVSIYKADLEISERSILLLGTPVEVVLHCIYSDCKISAAFESSVIGNFETKKSMATMEAQLYRRKYCPKMRKN